MAPLGSSSSLCLKDSSSRLLSISLRFISSRPPLPPVASLTIPSPFFRPNHALAWALQGVASATALRERLATEILASMNEDNSFGRYDVPVSTALAILALVSLSVGGQTVRVARLRLAAHDVGWPLGRKHSILFRPDDPARALPWGLARQAHARGKARASRLAGWRRPRRL